MRIKFAVSVCIAFCLVLFCFVFIFIQLNNRIFGNSHRNSFIHTIIWNPFILFEVVFFSSFSNILHRCLLARVFAWAHFDFEVCILRTNFTFTVYSLPLSHAHTLHVSHLFQIPNYVLYLYFKFFSRLIYSFPFV